MSPPWLLLLSEHAEVLLLEGHAGDDVDARIQADLQQLGDAPAPAPAPAPQANFCPACGAARQQQHRFCPQCGGAFDDTPSS